MKRIIGEYSLCLKKLYGSLRKRFQLNYDETLEEVDKVFDDEEFADYPVILISNDDKYSNEFIDEINAKGDGQAFGFYRSGDYGYRSVPEVREMVPKLLDDGIGQKFLYVSVDIRSFFRLALPGTICIKQGRYRGELSIDIIKTRKIISNELIRGLVRDDLVEFIELFNKLYTNRWEKRPDLFFKGYKFTSSELLNLCDRSNEKNAIVCVKNDKIVGIPRLKILNENAKKKKKKPYNPFQSC